MKVRYDAKHDIAYIRFSWKKPDGAIEIDEGVVLDTTAESEIVGIEIFDATKRLPVKSLLRLEITGRPVRSNARS
ncbi:MAG: DUF2283 domain-containing protein [Nitrososphaerales archaeon]